MAYSDYTFYTDTFYGSLIPSASYAKYSDIASDKINMVTFDSITDEDIADETIISKIRKAECAIAELLYKLDINENLTPDTTTEIGRKISSKAAGRTSVSYDNANNLIDRSITKLEDVNKQSYVVARQYLYNTGLLYAGL